MWRSEDDFGELVLSPLCEFQGPNLGHGAWQHMLLPTEHLTGSIYLSLSQVFILF